MPWSEVFRFFYILGFANAIFFSVLIFSKSEKSLADKILGSWFIVLGIQLLLPFLYLANIEKYYNFIGYEAVLMAAHPIFLFNYVKTITEVKTKLNKVVSSFVSIPIIAISLIPFAFYPFHYKKLIMNGDLLPLELVPGFALIFIIYFIFTIKCFKILKTHKTQTLHVFSYRDNIDLLWLRRILVTFSFLFILSLPVAIWLFVNNLSLAYADYIYYVTLVGFIFFMGYWGYKQGTIFNATKPNVISIEKTLSATVNNEYSKESHELKKVMEKEKPFLDPTLTIHQLATQINIPPHILSKVINKCYHKNFFEYINEYRIEHFKNLLNHSKYKNFTILGIALECGFNSKSAFNRIFKEQTGKTPGEFKK